MNIHDKVESSKVLTAHRRIIGHCKHMKLYAFYRMVSSPMTLNDP